MLTLPHKYITLHYIVQLDDTRINTESESESESDSDANLDILAYTTPASARKHNAETRKVLSRYLTATESDAIALRYGLLKTEMSGVNEMKKAKWRDYEGEVEKVLFGGKSSSVTFIEGDVVSPSQQSSLSR